VGDWGANTNLRRCTFAERGVLVEFMCLAHGSLEYGALRWSLKEIAQAIGCPVSLLRALRDKNVLKGADAGQRCKPSIFTPTHAGKRGEPVTLIPEQDGPIWYSSRMVRDEYLRQVRGRGTRFADGDTPKQDFGEAPKGGIGEAFGGESGDGLSVSLSYKVPTAYAVGVPDGTPTAGPPPIPNCPHEQIIALYHETLPQCPKVLEWNETRQGYLRARWKQMAMSNGASTGYRTTEDGLAYWRQFFEWVAQSDFLIGQADGRPGKPPFIADLEWLLRPQNFAKVIEGKYHDREAQAA
jgi:hypothetical protein